MPTPQPDSQQRPDKVIQNPAPETEPIPQRHALLLPNKQFDKPYQSVTME
jgi:hypothetical protein